MTNEAPTVALFITCLVDLFRPTIGFSTIKLLEQAGCKVSVPMHQTCCGQPAYNSGDRNSSRTLAKQTLDKFEGYDYVVVPSGSCAAMIRHHYADLLKTEAEFAARASSLAARTYELTSFLTDIRKVCTVDADFPFRVTYHDSCSGLRELGVREQPRTLLNTVRGIELMELEESNTCCGFGGTFCVKYPDISVQMTSNKVAEIALSNAEVVLSGDLGCLMNLAGRMTRTGLNVSARHVAEVLAGFTTEPPIGKGGK